MTLRKFIDRQERNHKDFLSTYIANKDGGLYVKFIRTDFEVKLGVKFTKKTFMSQGDLKAPRGVIKLPANELEKLMDLEIEQVYKVNS